LRIITLLFIALINCSTALANETIRLTIGEYLPYTSEKNVKAKVLKKIVVEAFKLEEITVSYSYFPWKRSYRSVENGDFDGIFPWNKFAERERLFHIHQLPILEDEYVYFHLKSTPFDWNTIEDLRKYKVGVTIGYKQEESFSKLGIKVDSAPSEESNYRKMLKDRIDVCPTAEEVGYATINYMFPLEVAKLFTHHPKVIEMNDYFILFSKKTSNGKNWQISLILA
jgi:polar amino acid transport system substrate-binding protein